MASRPASRSLLNEFLSQNLGDAAVNQRVNFLLPFGGFVVIDVNLGLVRTALGNQAVNQFDGLNVALVGQADAFQDDLFRDFHGTGFHHHDGVAVAGHDHVEFGGAGALVAGIDAVFTAVPGNAAGSDGAVEGNLAEGQCGGSSDHAQGFRRVLFVHREDGDDDLNFIVQALGEKRPDAAVGETSGQDGLSTGASFAAEEAAGDFADGVQTLFKLYGEGEKVDALPGLLGHYGGSEQDGFAAGDGYGAVGLLGEAAGFHCDGMPTDFTGDGEGVH